MIGIFLITSSPNETASIRGAIDQVENCELSGHCDNGQEAIFRLSSSPARIALVQVSLPDMNGIELIEQIRERVPHIGIVVPIMQGDEPGEVWQRIMQMGMSDLITSKMSPGEIVPLVQKVVKTAEELGDLSTSRSFMTTIASARGGTGKTLLSTNLIASMAKMNNSTNLIDFSMYPGDFFIMLDDVPRNTIADAISQGDVDAQFLNSLTKDHPLGFKYLACPNQDFDFYNFSYEQARALLQASRGVAEFTVVDTGAYDLPCTFAAIDEADLVFLVTTRDLAHLQAMQRYIKVLQERDIVAQKLKVIVNNAESGTELSESEVEDFLEHEVSVYLPSNPLQTTLSINEGKLLTTTKPELPLCKIINHLGELCLQRWQRD